MAFRCEVIAVGTELLLGSSVDTNSTWIGAQLARAGIDSHFHSKVGDNRARIASLLRLALERGNAVITCGGLGPTHDDLTREAIAAVMGVDLVADPAIAERIRALFHARGRAMPENNLRQAQVPRGATVLEPRLGTAPGLLCPVGPGVIYALPGVPHEMKEMFERAVLPDLLRRAGPAAAIVSRELRTWGDSESGVAERLAPLIERLDRDPRGLEGRPAPPSPPPAVTLAILASGIEGIRIRLTAKAPDPAAARARIEEEEHEVRSRLGSLVFGTDETTMEDAVLALLSEHGETLALAEGITAGLLATRIEERIALDPSRRGRFAGGLVLPEGGSLPDPLLGPASLAPPHVEALAEAVARTFRASVGLAVAGSVETPPDAPLGVEGARRPLGRVRVGLHRGGTSTSRELLLPGTPSALRRLAAISALDLLRRDLLRKPAAG